MTKKRFNTAAYIFDYDAEVAAFYRDWPEKAQTILFTDSNSVFYHGNDKAEAEIANSLSKNNLLFNAILKSVTDQSNFSVVSDNGLTFIILNLPRQAHDFLFLNPTAPEGMHDAFSMDHECAHALHLGARKDERIRECIGDAYAVIRHLQRFPSSTAVDTVPNLRAAEMILTGIPHHFTSPVVEQILADKDKIDFTKLSPQETLQKAYEYADQYAPDPDYVAWIAKRLSAFDCNANALTQGNYDGLRQLGQHLLATSDRDEFSWGSNAICALLNGELVLNGEEIISPRGKEWTLLRQALEAKAQKFEAPVQKSRAERFHRP